MFQQQLRIPGPTPIPERVAEAGRRPMINHRSAPFTRLLGEIIEGIQWAVESKNKVLIFPASGSGGMEAAIVNLLSPGEKALFCSCGAFGARWIQMARRYGVDVVELKIPLGQPVIPEDVQFVLEQDPEISTVYVTHNETSTGIMNPVADIARVVKQKQKLLVLDSVSAAGCVPMPTAPEADVVLSASQKGWMSPPGAAIAVVSAEAMQKAASSRLPRWYLDFSLMAQAQAKGETVTTPPISVLYAMHEALAMMREEGRDEIFLRHAAVAAMTQAGIEALGFALLAQPGYRSRTVTAVLHEGGKEALGQLRSQLMQKGVVVAGGQGELADKLFRIGHLGQVTPADIVSVLCSLEDVLAGGDGMGSGKGVAAARSALAAFTSSPSPTPTQHSRPSRKST